MKIALIPYTEVSKTLRPRHHMDLTVCGGTDVQEVVFIALQASILIDSGLKKPETDWRLSAVDGGCREVLKKNI